MRPLPAAPSLVLGAGLLALAVACAPSEQPPADTAVVPAGAAVDTAARSPDATATPLPAPSATAGTAPASRPASRTSGVTPATRGAATDTHTGPRIRPPSKAPGGYIIVPNTAHDSLRMAPPATGTTTGTSTRP